MATIAEIRQQYPQYADMSDEQLGKALHSKYYSDLPYEQFAQKAGIQAAPEPRSIGQELVRQGKLTLNAALKGLGSFPMAVADFGVGARNLVTGEGIQSPSQQWNQGIDQMLGAPETLLEKGVNIGGAALAGAAVPAPKVGDVPAGFNPKAFRAEALRKANESGIVVPPSTTNPTVINRLLESLGGKTATAQDASIRNRSAIDALVKSDLGLKATDEVGEGTLTFLARQAAQTGYKPVRGVGIIRLDGKFSESLDDIAAPYVKADKAFPGLNKNDIVNTVETLKQKAVDSDTAIDSIAILREKADTAYRQGDGAAGKAYKGMAKALEDALGRSLERKGEGELLKQYVDARKLIAQIHSAGKALNSELGSFDAGKLANQLARGKPLSGGMKKAAQASMAFPKATKLITDSGAVRNTDFILGGGAAAATGNPAPLIYPLSRMAVRDLLLSPVGQRLLATPSNTYGVPPALLMGGTAGLLGQQ